MRLFSALFSAFLSALLSFFCRFFGCFFCMVFVRFYVRFYVHFSLRFSLRFSLPFCFSLYISLHKEETGRRKQRKFLLSVWPYFRCSPKYGHFLYLNSKEETATHLRLYLRLLYITARKPVGLADLADLVETKVSTLKSLFKPRWFLH